MRNLKFKVIAGGSLFLILALALAASAQQGRQLRARVRNAVGMGLELKGFVRGLQLSDTQRQDIKAVLQSHKTDILESRKALLNARLALVKEDPNGPAAFGLAQQKLMDLRSQILGQIKTKLTADQLALLQKRQQRQADRIQAILDRLSN